MKHKHCLKKKLAEMVLAVPALLMPVSALTVPVSAETVTQEHAQPGVLYQTFFHTKTTGSTNETSTYSPDGEYLAVQGMPAYCIEPDADLTVGEDTYASAPLSTYARYTPALKQRINEIAHYGFMYRGRNDPLYWQVTQVMIWDAISPGFLDASFYRGGEDVTAEAMEYVRQISADISAYETQPHLIAVNAKGETVAEGSSLQIHTVTGDRITVTDEAGVLENYNLLEDSNTCGAVKDGNTVTIDVDPQTAAQEHTLRFVHTASDPNENPAALVFTAEGDLQTVASGLGAIRITPMETEITLRAEQLRLRVYKTDTEGNPAAGAKMQILDGSDVLYSFETGKDGFTVFPADALSLGSTYTLHEVSAPEGFVLAKDVRFTVTDTDTGVTMTDSRVYAAKTEADPSGETRYVSGASMQVEDADGNVVDSWTSSAEPHPVSGLREGGKYILREVKAPAGYVLAEPVRFTAKNTDVTVTMEDGTVTVRKLADPSLDPADSSLAKAPLAGARLEVKDAKTGKTVDAWVSGTEPHAVSGLQAGKEYILHEAGAPSGYRTADDIRFTAEGTSQEIEMTDTPVKGRFSVHKVITARSDSGFIKPEKGAEFTAIHSGYIEQYGSFAKALAAFGELRSDMAQKIRTGKDGTAVSEELVAGTYTVMQTKSGSEELEMLEEPFAFTIDASSEEVITFEAGNLMKEYSLRIEKTDAETGRLVSAAPAVFEILREDGTAVRQKIGLKTYTKFSTNALKAPGRGVYVNPDDTPGTVTLPLKLTAGTYTVRETEAPEGYIPAEPYTFEIRSGNVIRLDGAGSPGTAVQIANKQKTGSLSVHKEITFRESGRSLVIPEDITDITFELTVAEDIYDLCSGELLYQAGEVYGTYTPDENGNIRAGNIPCGKYVWKETSAPAGILKDTKEYPVDLSKDRSTKELTIRLELKNELTETQISKTAVASSAELPGAHLSVTEPDGTAVSDRDGNELSWISSDTPYVITGLEAGKEYVLTETAAPDQYTAAESVRFTVKDDGSVTQVHMENRSVSVSKQDLGGQELPGAKMSVTDAQGNTVDEWISADTPHYVRNLRAGNAYVLHEDTAPLGFVKATDIPFTAASEGENQAFVMVDRTAEVKKEDEEGIPVSGAWMQVFDRDGQVIDEWLSGAETHMVSGLGEGETYTVHEAIVPDGYYAAPDVTFTAAETGDNQTIVLCDRKIDYRVRKVYAGTKEPVEGVQLSLYDLDGAREPVMIHETADGEWQIMTGVSDGVLCAGHTYRLSESTWTAGVHKARDIIFTVGKEYSGRGPVTITMEDIETGIHVRKVREDGSYLAGAALELLDEAGSVVWTWISSDTAEDISDHVQGGMTYTVHEKEAPFGYRAAEDITFAAEGTPDHVQIIDMCDRPKEIRASVIKTEAGDSKKVLAGAVFEVYRRNSGETALCCDGTPANGMTDSSGRVSFRLPYCEEGYEIREITPPAGYLLNTETFLLEVPADHRFDEDSEIAVMVADQPVPGVPTGVRLPRLPVIACILSMIVLAMVINAGPRRTWKK